MKMSYSRVNLYNTCPFKYKLKYEDHLETKFNELPNNPLALGTAVHEGIEHRDIDHAIENYKSNYSIWDNNNEVEVLKLKYVLPKAINSIPEGEYEHKLDVPDDFVGYIDLLVKVEDGVYDLYDFKYSNNSSKYKKSGQIHVYKHYYETITGNKIRDMYYAMIPKSNVKLIDAPDLDSLEKLIKEDLSEKEVTFVKVKYDPSKVNYFKENKVLVENAKHFIKKYNNFCSSCEYNKFCSSHGTDRSELKEKTNEDDVNL